MGVVEPSTRSVRRETVAPRGDARTCDCDPSPSNPPTRAPSTRRRLQDFFLEQKDGGWAMRPDANRRLDSLVSQAAGNLAAERDGKMADVLRNTLFGEFGEDLASRNIFRGRDMGIVDYAALAECYEAIPKKKVRQPPLLSLPAAA